MQTADHECIISFREFILSLSPYIDLITDDCSKKITKTVTSLVLKNNAERFFRHDEKVFNLYSDVMDDYRRTVMLYQNSLPDVNDSQTKDILEGISQILTAQINSFEEAGKDNPIRREKENFIKRIFLNLSGAIKGIISSAPNSGISYCFSDWDDSVTETHSNCLNHFFEEAVAANRDALYKCYLDEDFINSMDTPAYNYYYDALAQEKETLRSIVDIQLKPLLDGEDSGTAQSISDSLLESYERILKSEERLTPPKKVVTEAPPIDLEMFAEAIVENIPNNEIKQGTITLIENWKEKREVFFQNFTLLTQSIIQAACDMLPYKQALYEIRKGVADKLILTDEMLDGFRRLQEYCELNKDKLNGGDFKDIVGGIKESVSLKIDVLDEGKEAFEVSANEAAAALKPPDTEFSADTLAKWAFIWLNEMESIDIYDSEYENIAQPKVQVVLDSIRNLAQTEGQREDYGKARDRIKKMEIDYLRDYVLYEVGTYEEILTYSVAKLRDCDDANLVSFAAECDKLLTALQDTLKRHGIDIINPEVNSFFDSKEHEVLVAEKNGDMKKGQIIKKLNSGFKYDGLVLVRANVIAAR